VKCGIAKYQNCNKKALFVNYFLICFFTMTSMLSHSKKLSEIIQFWSKMFNEYLLHPHRDVPPVFVQNNGGSPWSHGGSLWSYGAHRGTVEAHSVAMEAHLGTMEAHSGATEARLGAMKAHSGAVELTLELCRLTLEP
jgi:hypothetical protein